MGCCASKNRVGVIHSIEEDSNPVVKSERQKQDRIHQQGVHSGNEIPRVISKKTGNETAENASFSNVNRRKESPRNGNGTDTADENVKHNNIGKLKIAEAFSEVFGDNEQEEDLESDKNRIKFGQVKGTPELKRGNAHIIPTDRKETNNHHTQSEQMMGQGGRPRIRGTCERPRTEESENEGLYKQEIKGDIEIKDYDDEVSAEEIDLTSSGSCIVMVLCEVEEGEPEIKTDNSLEIHSLNDDDDEEFCKELVKDVNKESEQRDGQVENVNGTVPKTEFIPPRAPFVERSTVPQIIQVTSVEKSKIKYSYQYSGDYYGQLERPGSRRNTTQPIDGAGESVSQVNQDDVITYHGMRRGGLIQVVPSENYSRYSYQVPKPPTEPPGERRITRVSPRSRHVKDNFTDLVIKEVVKGHLDEDASMEEAKYDAVNLDKLYNRLTTPERDRKNRPKSSYSIRNRRRYTMHPHPLETSEDAHHDGSQDGNHSDVNDHDVTLNITSGKASKVLGLDVVPPIVSYKKLESEEADALTDSRPHSRQNIPKETVILRASTKSPNFMSGMGSRAMDLSLRERATMPQWSRYLPP